MITDAATPEELARQIRDAFLRGDLEMVRLLRLVGRYTWPDAFVLEKYLVNLVKET